MNAEMRSEVGKSILFGVAVGDALGVPVEFKSRKELQENPVTNMMGYGTYNQPKGTWSDDSSLTFCLAESLVNGYQLNDIADKFKRWLFDSYWTPHGHVFDVGISTREAIERLQMGYDPRLSGGMAENQNGNGSLMRILPLIFYLRQQSFEKHFSIIKDVSSITHGHFRSIFSCFIYLEFALLIWQGRKLKEAYSETQNIVKDFAKKQGFYANEVALFNKILEGNITDLGEDDIRGSGYVLHALEASFWCLMTSDSYKSAVLKAINLGEDTDTTGAITGGLAGLYYGYEQIPEDWKEVIARKEDILELANYLQKTIN